MDATSKTLAHKACGTCELLLEPPALDRESQVPQSSQIHQLNHLFQKVAFATFDPKTFKQDASLYLELVSCPTSLSFREQRNIAMFHLEAVVEAPALLLSHLLGRTSATHLR